MRTRGLKLCAVAVAACVVLALASSIGIAQDDNSYTGNKKGKCKMCHAKQFKSWQKTPHATAFDRLSDAEKKDVEMLKTHTVGHGQPGGFKSVAETPELVNVGCEACHGPAAKHVAIPLSKKEEKRASILTPKEKNTCAGCHTEHEITEEMKTVQQETESKTTCLGCHDPHGQMKK